MMGVSGILILILLQEVDVGELYHHETYGTKVKCPPEGETFSPGFTYPTISGRQGMVSSNVR